MGYHGRDSRGGARDGSDRSPRYGTGWPRTRPADPRTASADADDPAEGAGGPSGPASGRITAIKPQVRDAERVSVFLDGTFAFGLGAQLALDEGLSTGDELTAARVAALRAADDVGKATNAALALLARRPRSLREVRDRLRLKDYGPATIEAAVAKLEGWNYVDDADFARYWVENRAAHKPRGRRLLEQELRQKGIDREVVREAIDATDLDERAAAVEVGRAKLRSYAGLAPAVAHRRLGAYLARRGFGYDVVRPALDELLGEGGDGPDGEA